ncbi:uncharacterized protein N0V89_002645 [Didymosphaeria variabile]|uniref:Uncharacterized protein n=1 Tax=Didymosphaeria variabile TaxID=1932322 RepID=A0A9W8XSH6_9PLEO|nr:uncharacterized protein N0V89_002645 [Didymosphaeria variabile]KAJ4358066.1 hypothetical protein N0V89_002645 [Didymosphaeria variabile]
MSVILDASQIDTDMAPESASDDHPARHASRSRPSRENTIPSALLKRDRSASATPKVERTMSMTDSFILEHLKHAGPQSPPSELDDSHPGTPRKDKDTFAPISNWAHLSYLKTQRTQLRTELKVHQVAGAEAKHSISSLRRLAFRMAVNISVKEKQIANTARNLASSRKKNYLSTRDTEKRIAELTKSLQEEEYRNKDILECLEKASMLTLQYSDPDQQVSNRMQPGLASPPNTPPTRILHGSHNSTGTPKTPTRPTSSLWGNNGCDFTPESSTADIRTQDGRLIQAKRESDRALAVCRDRVAQLRTECAKNNDAAGLWTATQTGLEAEIENHQTRIANLERSRAAVEENLRQTKLELEESAKFQGELRADLQSKREEVKELESTSKDRQDTIRKLTEEKASLQAEVENYDGRLQKLETCTTGLEEELKNLHRKLSEAEQREADLRDRLAENEIVRRTMDQQLRQGRENVATLEKSVFFFQGQITEESKKVKVSSGVISSLRNDVKESEELKRHAEAALAVVQGSLTELESRLHSAEEANHDLRAELDSSILAHRELEKGLRSTKAQLADEAGQKEKLQTELYALRQSRDILEHDLEAAKARIQELEGADAATKQELQSLRESEATIERDLEAAHRHSGELQKGLDENSGKLASLQTHTNELTTQLQKTEQARTALEAQLHGSEQKRSMLEAQLEDSHKARSETVTRLNTLFGLKADIERERNTHQSQLAHMTLEATGLQSQLSLLKDELHQSQQTKVELEERLEKAQSEAQALSAESSALHEQLSVNLKTHSEAQEHLGSLQGEAATLNIRISELQGRADAGDISQAEVERSLRESVQNLEILKRELTNTQDRLSTVDGESETLRSKLSSLETDWTLVQASKKEIDRQLKEATEDRSKRENEVESLSFQLGDVTSERDELLVRVAATEQDLKKLQEARIDFEERLAKETELNMELDSELRSTRSKLYVFQTENATLQTRLTENSAELKNLQLKHRELDERLTTVAEGKASLEEDVTSARGLHKQSETNAATLNRRIVELSEEADSLRLAKAEVEQRLEEVTKSNEDVEKELGDARSRLSVFKVDTSALHTKLSDAHNELDIVRKAKTDLEERFSTAAGSTNQVEKDLEAVRSQLQEQEFQGATMISKISEADKELAKLKQTNDKLNASEKDLMHRLEVAEEELRSVQTANTRLETFLDKVEQDMLKAEAAFADSEQRLDEFVTESEAKINAATTSKLKYKRRLTARNKEIEILIDENSALHHHVSDQSRELESIVQSKNKLLAEAQGKEKTIQELEWAHEERLRNEHKSKDDQLEELRRIQLRSESDYESQIQKRDSAMSDLKQEQQNRLRLELQAKDSKINEIQKDKDEFAASLAAVEAELWELRENKESFEALVQTLNERIQHLEESNRPQESVEIATPTFSDAKIHQEDAEAGPSTPLPPKRTTTVDGEHGRSSVQPDVPLSSTEPADGSESWSREVDRVRLLRDETANQLKGMKKLESDLRKSLKDSEKQLHDLERSGKNKRTPTVLRKRSHYTPARDTETLSPSRPATAGLLHNRNTSYQHNSLFQDKDDSPGPERPETASPVRPKTAGHASSPRRWSSLPRPGSSYRPATSKSYGRLGTGLQDVDEHGMMVERPKTSLGGPVGRNQGDSQKKRFTSLRRLFHKET